jgi:hypothetical protein
VLLGLAAPSAAAPSDVGKPVFDGNPGWLVIGEATSNRREAALKADGRVAQGVPVAVVRSDLFQGLSKGLMVLVYGRFADKDGAAARAAELKAKGIKVYVKNSGPLAVPAGARPYLLRVWGRLEDRIRFPTEIDISDAHDEKIDSVYTDRQGRYQTWIFVPASKKKGRLELCGTAPAYGPTAECAEPPGSGGWFDICGHVDYAADARDVQVDWTPSPDCYGE